MELEIKASALSEEELRADQVLSLAEQLFEFLGEPRSVFMEAHYHDDPKGLLRAQNWALRARYEQEAGFQETIIATVKGPAEDHQGVPGRVEINTALTALPEAGDPLPAELSRSLHLAEVPLDHWPGALWTTRVERSFIDLKLPGGGRAELAIDQGMVITAGNSHPISELELELREGAPAELLTAAAQLCEQLAVRPMGRSKAARGLQLLGRLRPPEAQPQADQTQLWGRLWELEEWLREGHHEQLSNYRETLQALASKLSPSAQLQQRIDMLLHTPMRQLHPILNSKTHAKFLWDVLLKVHG